MSTQPIEFTSTDFETGNPQKLASKYNYNVFVATVENYHLNKNSHGISDEQLQKMAAASAMQMAERKKQIQDDIKAKQQEIQDLQKELATIK